jgi:hypothetical protein
MMLFSFELAKFPLPLAFRERELSGQHYQAELGNEGNHIYLIGLLYIVYSASMGVFCKVGKV